MFWIYLGKVHPVTSHAATSHWHSHSSSARHAHPHGLHRCHLLHVLDLRGIDYPHCVNHLQFLNFLSKLKSSKLRVGLRLGLRARARLRFHPRTRLWTACSFWAVWGIWGIWSFWAWFWPRARFRFTLSLSLSLGLCKLYFEGRVFWGFSVELSKIIFCIFDNLSELCLLSTTAPDLR